MSYDNVQMSSSSIHKLLELHFIPDIEHIINIYYTDNIYIGKCNVMSFIPSNYTIEQFSKVESNGHRRFLKQLIKKYYHTLKYEIRLRLIDNGFKYGNIDILQELFELSLIHI